MTALTSTIPAPVAHSAPRRKPPIRRGRVVAQVFMITAMVLWITPIVFALYVSLRPIASTNKYGYVSMPHGGLTLKNFKNAWTQSDMLRFFENSVRITVPAVIITLALASAVAFIVTRLNFKFNIGLLILFTAGNLLPPQVLITPLFRIYLTIHLPHFISSSGLLYNYMKTIPAEMYEAAVVDGATLWTRYWRLTLPLCRPALAALATLLTTWIYNDFFWAITLISTGNKRPITSALANLQGEFVSNQNVISAAALIAAIPTLIVYVLLQKQFIAGLSLGSAKG